MRLDVLAERTGIEHCGTQDTHYLHTGVPIGTRFSTRSDARLDSGEVYVSDARALQSAHRSIVGSQKETRLPTDAVDTGFRRDDTELWVANSQPDAVFMKSDAGVQRWLSGEPLTCE